MQKEFHTTTELHGAEINKRWFFPSEPDANVKLQIKGSSHPMADTIAESEVPLEEVPERVASLYIQELQEKISNLEHIYNILEAPQ